MLKKIALFVASLVLSLGMLEYWTRSGPPSRWQRVTDIEMLNGIPVWRVTGKAARGVENDDCVKDGVASVVLLGDSILHGVLLDAEDTLGPSLGRSLKEADGSDACVVNLSIPGFTLEQELAVIKHRWAELRPKVVVLEIWQNTPHRIQAINGHAYNFGHLLTDEEGLPNPHNIPPSINKVLFSKSAIWRRLIEGGANKGTDSRLQWVSTLDEMDAFYQWLVARDSELVLAFATKLKHPWSEGREIEHRIYKTTRDWATKNNIPMVWFDEILSSRKVEDVRLDECCHLNHKGMAIVSDHLTDMLQPMLTAPSPEATDAAH